MTRVPVEAGARPLAVLDHAARHLVQVLADVRTGDAPALRQARVTSRRLREMFVVVEAMGGGVSAKRARRRLRRVTRALGPMRELDMAIAELDRAAARHGWTAERLAPLRRWLGKEVRRRRHALAAFLDDLDETRLVRGLAGTRRLLTGDEVPRRWRAAVVAGALRRLRAVAEAADACGTLYAPARLHRLRIAVKKLRYALELAEQTSDFDVTRAIAALKQRQQRYGDLHDTQVLLHLVTAVAAVGRATPLRVTAELVADALERDCRDLHAACLADLAALVEWLPLIRRALATSVLAAHRAVRAAKPTGVRRDPTSRRTLTLAG